MKRKILFVLLSFLITFSCMTSPKQKSYADSVADNAVIILEGEINEENELVIEANLTYNTGISDMLLELVYDKNAMTLQSLVYGTALASLSPLATGSEQATQHFYIYYSGNNNENDTSTGRLFTLTFKLDDNIQDGTYKVSLKYKRNQDVSYIQNGEVRQKNLSIDNAVIEIKNNSVTKITKIQDDEEATPKPKSWIGTVILCVSIVAVIAGTVVAIILLKKRRNWKRL